MSHERTQHELQARLAENQRGPYVDSILGGNANWGTFDPAWQCTNATANQRTRAIFKVIFGLEVEG